MMPPCEAPISLSPLEVMMSAPRADRLRQRWLGGESKLGEVDQGTGPHVVDQRQPMGVGDRDHLLQRHLGGEPGDLVVARMHP